MGAVWDGGRVQRSGWQGAADCFIDGDSVTNVTNFAIYSLYFMPYFPFKKSYRDTKTLLHSLHLLHLQCPDASFE